MSRKQKSVKVTHKDLKVVKTAGFKLNKKEKNTNRRAGLHDKKKDLQGEERVYRRKPLALVHVRRMRKAAVALSCLFIIAVSIFGAGMFLREDVEKLTGFRTVCYELPADGTSPLDHTLVENVGYMNYALKHQEFWSSEMSSKVNAMGFEQSVATFKKYYNGILISADVAQGFSSKATQFCVNEEKNVILWRPSADKNFNGMDTEWSTGAAEGCTFEEFIKFRGFPPSEFSVYILNENTIANAQDYSVTDNGDGTYSMTIELNVGMGNTEPERAADYYYTKQMMVTGDLSTEPSITKTNVTYNFDRNWRVLSFEIYDEYTAMGVVPCTSNTKVVFDYSEENAKNTFYEDYFKAQEENYAPPSQTDSKPSAAEYLGAAFGSVLSEGGIFKLDLNIDKLNLSGAVFVGLKDGALTDVRAEFGDIFVYFDGAELYISDGSAKYKLALDDLLTKNSLTKDGAGGIDFDKITEQLMGGEFIVGENSATLKSTLEIFNIAISLQFDFVNDGSAIKLGYCSARIPVGDKVINAGMQFGTKEDIPEIPSDLDKYTDVLNEGITLDLSLKIDGLTLEGFACVQMNGGSFEGLLVSLGGLDVYYRENTLYIADGNAKYKIALPEAGDVDFGGLLSSIDVKSLLGQIIENLAAGNGTISTSATVELLGQTVSAALGIKIVGGIEITADAGIFGFDATVKVGLSNRPVTVPDLSEYIDILNEGITLSVGLSLDKLQLNGKVFIGLENGKFTEVRADFGDIAVYYKDNTLYITDGKVKYKVALPESEGISLDGLDLNALLQEVINNLKFADGKISTSATIEGITANITLNLVGGISAEVSTELYGIPVKATVGLTNDEVPAPNVDEYTDILNEGITLSVGLSLDTLHLNGKVFIGLENGKFTELRADFGDIKVYYSNNTLYITDGNVKYKVALPESEGLSLDLDFETLLKEVIENLKFADGKISTSATIEGITANVTLNLVGGISAEVTTELYGIPVKATVGLTDDEVPAPIDTEYTDILNEGITLSVGLSLDALQLNGKVFIGLENGKFTELRADFGDIKVYYINNTLYLTDGNVKYKVALPESNGLSLDLDFETLLKEVIENLKFADGKISTSATIEGITANVTLNLVGGISAEVTTELYGIPVKATVGLTNELVAEPNYEEYADILNEGITLNVGLSLDTLQLNGKVFIGLENGKFTELRADFGDIKVYYINNTLYITDGNVKYKVALPESEGLSLDGLDLNALLQEVINNLKFADGKISTSATIEGITANITLSLVGGISAEVSTELYGIPVKATVGLTNETVSAPNVEEYADILNEGITLNVGLSLDTLHLNGKVFIGLDNGKFTELRADFGDIAVYYKDNTLYITDGNVKYKVALPESEGISLDGLDLNALLQEVINNLKFADGKISTSATIEGITANITLNLVGGISADVSTELYGIPVKATVGLTNEEVAEPNYEEYTDILNEGITLNVGLSLDSLQLKGKVFIGLENGKFTELRADFGDIKVYYVNNTLYITDGNVKYKVALPESNGLSLDGLDLNALLQEVINNLKFADGKISTIATIEGITANVTLNIKNGISADVSTELYGIPVKATVGLTNETVSAPNYEEYTDILNEGITLNVGLSLDSLQLKGKVFIGLENGKFTELRADFGDIAVYYKDNTLYITDGNVKYKVALPASEGLSLDGLDLNALLQEVINNLKFADGKISTSATIEGITANITLSLVGGISAEVSTELYGIPVKATVGLTNEEVAEPNYEEYTDILNEGITLSVGLSLDSLQLSGKVFIGLENGKFTELRADFGDIKVYYINNTLYITDGNVKYKVALPESNGLSLDLDFETLLKEVIENLKFADGKISTSATIEGITANITLSLVGGISAEVSTELYGIPVKATVGLTNETVSAPNVEEYADILNEGITLNVGLSLDTLHLNGKVFIGLENGKFTELRADFGDIKVYYINNTLYITDGNVKYKVALPESNGLSLDLDFETLLKEVINNLKFADGKISTSATIEGITANVTLNLVGGISADISTELYGIPVKATVGLTNDEVPAPVDAEYTDILNEGITLNVGLSLDTLQLNGKVFIGLENGKFTELRADFGDIAVYYKDNTLYITDGNVKYKVALPESEGISLDGLDLNALLQEVINNLKFADGKISTSATIEGITANITLSLVGGISAEVSTELYGIPVQATVGLTNDEVPAPNVDEYTDILNEGITLSVGLSLDSLQLNGKVFIGLENGKFTELRADFGDIKVYYVNNILYITDGTVKYKVTIPENNAKSDFDINTVLSPLGISLEGFDFNTVLTEVLNNLAVTDGSISTSANIAGLNAKVVLNIKNGISATVTTAVKDIPVTATVGLINETVAEPDYKQYTDILNEGITLSASVALDKLQLNGKVFIGLKDGKFTEVRADFDDIAVYYVNNILYITDGTVKYKVTIPENNAKSDFDKNTILSPLGISLEGFDFNTVLTEILNNLAVTDGSISTSANIAGLKANVVLNIKKGISAIVTTDIKDIPVTATVGLTNETVAEPDYKQYTDILNEGITLSASVALDKLQLNGKVFIGLENGKFTEVRADFGDIKVYYVTNTLYITDGNVKYKVALPASTANSNFDINAILSTLGITLDGFEFKEVLPEILNNISFKDGSISTSANIAGLKANVVLNIKKGISAIVTTDIKDIPVTATVGLTNDRVPAPVDAEYTDILNEGITLDVALTLNEIAFDGRVFIGLNGGKINELRADFGGVKVFYESADNAVYLQVGTTKAYIDFDEMSDGLIDLFNLFKDAFGKDLDIDTQTLICELLGNLTVGLRDISTNANILLNDCIIPANATVILPRIVDGNREGLKVEADVNLFGIQTKVKAGLPKEEVPALSDGDKESYINVINDTFRLLDELVGDRITITANGTLTDAGEAYRDFGGVKYEFGAVAEYEKGKGIYELKTLNEDGTESVTKVNEIYLHLNIALNARLATDTSLVLDFVLADANPVSTADNGKTGGGYFKDGEFDVYISVSKYSDNRSPLKLYAPAEDILTLVSMAGAALNLDDISFKDSKYLSEAAATIADLLVGELSKLLNNTLLDKYLPYTQSQFASLGDSLIPQILGTDLKGLIEKLFSSLSGEEPSDGGVPEEKEPLDFSEKYVKELTFNDDTLKLVLDSNKVYKSENLADMEISVSRSKGADEIYRLSGITLENIYFGAGNKNNLGIETFFTYGEVARADEGTAFKDYLNLTGIDNLLKAAVNSATHETGDTEIPYELNREYLLSGTVHANLTSLVNVDINIHTAKIVIGEDNSVSADVHLSYPGVQELGIVAIQGASDLYLSIKNDMVYIKRIQKTYFYRNFLVTYEGTYETPVEETRIMPISYFTEHIMEQINFMFNFGSVVADQLNKIDLSQGTDVSFEGKDLGATLDYILAKYKYTESGSNASWTFAISGAILTDAVGMTMSDIPVTLNAVKEDGGLYTLTDLEIGKSTMSLLGSIGLEFSGKLTYCNPHEELIAKRAASKAANSVNVYGNTTKLSNRAVFADEYNETLYTDTTIDLADDKLPELNGLSWSDVLGGNTFADICGNTNWNLLTGDTNLGYLAFGTNFKPRVSMLDFKRANGESNAEFIDIGEEQVVLYNPDSKRIYTKAQTPDIRDEAVMPYVDGVTRVWHPEYIEDNGKLYYCAFYDTTYTIIIDSPYKTDGNYASEDGVWRRYIYNAYKQAYIRKDLTFVDGDGVIYGLEGYKSSADATELLDLGVAAVNDNGELCYRIEVNGDMKYYASWKRMYAVTFIDGDNEQIVYYYDGERLSERLPELDNPEENPRVWLADGNQAVTDEMTVKVGYTVNIVSDRPLLGDNFTVGENGEYIVSGTYAEGTVVELSSLYVKNATHLVEGYYDNAERAGNPVSVVTLDSSVTYYPKWVGKDVIVTYESDAPLSDFTGGTKAIFNFDNADDGLMQAAGDGNIFLGWFMDLGGSYSYAGSADDVKNYFAGLNSADDKFEITLRAACAKDLTVNKPDVKFSTTIQYAFTYSINFAEGLSESILQSAGVSAEVSVGFHYRGTALVGGSRADDWDNTYTYAYGGANDIRWSHNFGNGLNKNKRGYVTVAAAFKINGAVLGSLSEVTSEECSF